MTASRAGAAASIDLRPLLVCPVCRSALDFTPADRCRCASCARTYARVNDTWILIDESLRTGPLWEAWDQLQANGVASYESDPTRNLSVGRRDDCLRFGEFCRYRGRVLDIGCGPQSWPAYLLPESGAEFIGIDPLAGATPQHDDALPKVCGLAEHLPFRDRIFNQAIFATTLDHFVDPLAALREASRVCRIGGELLLWLGEKKAGAPRPATSPKWYQDLVKPDLADDFFHVKRLTLAEFEALIAPTPLKIARRLVIEVDAWRTNFFVALTNGDAWTS